MTKRKAKRKTGKRKRKGKKMPANVKKYFQLLGSGMSKASARKEAGLPPKSKSRKRAWGLGNALYDYQHKRKKR